MWTVDLLLELREYLDIVFRDWTKIYWEYKIVNLNDPEALQIDTPSPPQISELVNEETVMCLWERCNQLINSWKQKCTFAERARRHSRPHSRGYIKNADQ